MQRLLKSQTFMSKFSKDIRTGTLVSQDYVVTAASIFDRSRITVRQSNHYKTISVKDKENFEVLVAAKANNYAFSSLESLNPTYPDYDWTAIAEIKIHPHYKSNNEEYANRARFDVAVIKLKIRDDFKTTSLLNIKLS